MKQRPPSSDGSTSSASAMRNGSKIGSSLNRSGGLDRRKANAYTFRAFLIALVLAACVLAGLALHLLASVANHNNNSGGNGISASSISQVNNAKSDSVSAAARNNNGNAQVQVSDAKSEIIVPPPNNIQNKAKLPYPNGPRTDAKYAKDRVYCMVPFIWNKEMYDVIMKTWGKRCNVINFLTDAEVIEDGGRLQGDEIIHKGSSKGYKHHTEFPAGHFPDSISFIEMTRPWTGCKDKKTGKLKVCRHIWEKMWQSWIYVADHHLNEAEWFCKVDYDTFFFPENLQYYVRDDKGWDAYNEHHYFGLELLHKVGKGHPSMVAGAAACWSHKTLGAIAEVYKKMPKGFEGNDRGRCEDRPQASEEISTSMCLYKELNVTAEAMRDDEMREYVMVDPYNNMLGWNRTEQGEWWYWQGKPANIGQMEDCCSVHPMGIHKYKQKWQIELLDQQFYGLANNKEIAKLKERERRYVDKVRKAIGIDQ